ncbi:MULTISPECIES: hypothetical protein, partial [Enterobacterales]|uniref:hypothetical protein n=1 Tax=Enterobacterales TaxID=91347 RepID=UPI0019535DE0
MLIAGIPLGIAPLAAMQIVARPAVPASPGAESAARQTIPEARPLESSVRKQAVRVAQGLPYRRDKPVPR